MRVDLVLDMPRVDLTLNDISADLWLDSQMLFLYPTAESPDPEAPLYTLPMTPPVIPPVLTSEG